MSRQGPPPKPDDPTVRTLYVGGIDSTYTDKTIREHFAPFGAIADIHMVGDRGCCFVTYVKRADAENAVNSLFDCLFIRGRRMKVVWGKGKVVKKAPSRNLCRELKNNDGILFFEVQCLQEWFAKRFLNFSMDCGICNTLPCNSFGRFSSHLTEVIQCFDEVQSFFELLIN